MARVKIALCITDLDVGGAEQSLVALATRLDRARFTPTVYCLGPKPLGSEASCLPPLEAGQVEVQFLGACGVAAFPRVVGQLKRHFLLKQPDLVQTFLFHANVVGRIAARRAGVPRVVCGVRVAERKSRWHLWVDRLTARNVDRYVCVSQAVARFSIEEAGLPADRMTVIPNGVDVDRYPASDPIDPGTLGIGSGRRFVTFVGRLEPQKGLRWLIQSAPNWLARVPDCDLLVVGRGPEQKRLERLCVEMGIAGRVHWAGWRNDVPQILAASSILVLPSRWEGMPNTVLEAMAEARPVVATSVGGAPELVISGKPNQPAPGETGIIVLPESPDLLGIAMASLLGDGDRRKAMGEAAKTRVAEKFSIEKMVNRYMELYDKLNQKI